MLRKRQGKPRLPVNLEKTVLDQIRSRRITIRQGADMLGLAYVDMNELLRDSHIPVAADTNLIFRRSRRPPSVR